MKNAKTLDNKSQKICVDFMANVSLPIIPIQDFTTIDNFLSIYLEYTILKLEIYVTCIIRVKVENELMMFALILNIT